LIGKSILVIRHAKSSWKDASLADFDRPLNKRGKHDVLAMSRYVAEHCPTPDVVYSSSSIRTRRTVEPFVRMWELPHHSIHFTDDLYHTNCDGMLEQIRQWPNECATVALFGHNPGLHDLVEVLADVNIEKFPTCAIARIELHIADWHKAEAACGTLMQFDAPKTINKNP